MRGTTQAASASSGDEVCEAGSYRVLVNVTQTNNSICHISRSCSCSHNKNTCSICRVRDLPNLERD